MNEYHEKSEEKKEPEVPDWQSSLVDLVFSEWERGTQHCDQLNDLYDTLYAMIRGERPEKNYDWQSNVVINKAFQVVWTAIPYICQKVFGSAPIMGVASYDRKGAMQREKILEFWHNLQVTTDKNHIPYFINFVMWILRALLNGVAYKKKGWHQKLEKKSVEYDVPVGIEADGQFRTEKGKKSGSIPIEDWPHDIIVNNKDIVVDWLLQPGQSCRQGRFIIHRSILDLDALYSSKVKYMNLGDISPYSSSEASEINQDHQENKSRDGLDSPPSSDIYADVEVYERCGAVPVYKKKKDGHWEPCLDKEKIFTDEVTYKQMYVTVARQGKGKGVLIRFEENKYGEMPYVDMHIYLDQERWQSVGMVEPAKDVYTAINDNINAMFDEIWANLMPPAVVNKFALWDWDTMQYAPRQRWLVGGNPAESIMWKPPSNITSDAWQKHVFLDTEGQLTTAITPPMQGGGKEKAATTNVLNAQMSAGKLDFVVKMIETTALIPDAQMDVSFAKKFAHPATFKKILGEPFEFSNEELYRYVPCAASVKLEHQKETEIQQDIQLIQLLSPIQNPNTPKVINALLGNIFRNRNLPKEAAMLDEEYFEPQGDAGQMQMMKRIMGKQMPSNQNGVQMSGQEQSVRQLTYEPEGLANG